MVAAVVWATSAMEEHTKYLLLVNGLVGEVAVAVGLDKRGEAVLELIYLIVKVWRRRQWCCSRGRAAVARRSGASPWLPSWQLRRVEDGGVGVVLLHREVCRSW